VRFQDLDLASVGWSKDIGLRRQVRFQDLDLVSVAWSKDLGLRRQVRFQDLDLASVGFRPSRDLDCRRRKVSLLVAREQQYWLVKATRV